MSIINKELFSLFPALAFLLAGVPLAVLLDKLGFFSSAASLLLKKHPSVFMLWLLAAVTTIIFNLDTTIVLLTPLYIHIAKREKIDPLPLLVIPLLLASFASSMLPVSNLTNLIMVNALHISVSAFILHLGLPTVVAIVAGWLFYRWIFPLQLTAVSQEILYNRRALGIGCSVLVYLLIGFTLGAIAGVPAWIIVLLADMMLIAVTRVFPWRAIPFKTAVSVAVIAGMILFLVPNTLLQGIFTHASVIHMFQAALLATVGSNTINNLPTALIGAQNATSANWSIWAWLIGVNVGAVLLPIGAVANLLWRSIAKQNNIHISFRQYIAMTLPIGLPTLALACLVLVAEYIWLFPQ